MESWQRHDRSDVAGMRAHAEELQARFEKMVRDAPAIHERAKAIEVTEKSNDGLIWATVGPRGDLIELELDPRIYRRPDSQSLAETITDTIKAAGAKAQNLVLDMFAPVISREDMLRHLTGDTESARDRMSDEMQGKGQSAWRTTTR